jgi:spermidine synthase
MGRTDQSHVDLDDPLRLVFGYMQWLADCIDLAAVPGGRVRAVHVGGALMTLPRYVAATRPSSAQIVLEPDTELTEFVRRHVPLPKRSGIKVRDADGRSGIAALRDRYAQLVVVDAFAGSRVPAALTTTEFFADVARVLDDGVMLINITDQGSLSYTRRVLSGMTKTFPHVLLCAESATLKGRRFGNVVIGASRQTLPADELAGRSVQSTYPYRVIVADRLQQMIGGAAPFTDTDSLPSPAAPQDSLRHLP